MHHWPFPIVNGYQGQMVLVSIVRPVHTQRADIHEQPSLHLVNRWSLALRGSHHDMSELAFIVQS